MVERREILTASAAAFVNVGLTGCMSDGEADTETPPAATDTTEEFRKTETAPVFTGTSVESSSPTPSETPTTTQREMSTSEEVTDLEMNNQTKTTHSLTLTVDQKDGKEVTDTWVIEGSSTIRVDTYEPIHSRATLTADVEGYESTTYDWQGKEPGETLEVLITSDSLEFESLIR